MRWLPDHMNTENKSKISMAKTTDRATKHALRSKNAKLPHQVSKYLELPETRRTAEVVDKAAAVDTEAPGGKTPNNDGPAIHHLLASGESPWIIPKEPLPLTGMMQQNSGRCF